MLGSAPAAMSFLIISWSPASIARLRGGWVTKLLGVYHVGVCIGVEENLHNTGIAKTNSVGEVSPYPEDRLDFYVGVRARIYENPHDFSVAFPDHKAERGLVIKIFVADDVQVLWAQVGQNTDGLSVFPIDRAMEGCRIGTLRTGEGGLSRRRTSWPRRGRRPGCGCGPRCGIRCRRWVRPGSRVGCVSRLRRVGRDRYRGIGRCGCVSWRRKRCVCRIGRVRR